FRLHHKHKKAASAGAAKPAPLGPRRNGALVIVVDVPSGNPGGEAPLHRPAAVKSLAQLLEVDKAAGTERAKLVRVVAHVPEHLGVWLCVPFLLGHHRCRGAWGPLQEHHDVAKKRGGGAFHAGWGLAQAAPAAPEAKQIEPAESGGVLILLADRL